MFHHFHDNLKYKKLEDVIAPAKPFKKIIKFVEEKISADVF